MVTTEFCGATNDREPRIGEGDPQFGRAKLSWFPTSFLKNSFPTTEYLLRNLDLPLGPEVPDDGECERLLVVCVSQTCTETRDAREWGGVATFSAAREKWPV